MTFRNDTSKGLVIGMMLVIVGKTLKISSPFFDVAVEHDIDLFAGFTVCKKKQVASA